MELKTWYEQAKSFKDSVRIHALLEDLRKAAQIPKYLNDFRRILSEIAGNAYILEEDLIDIILNEPLDIVYRASDNIGATEIALDHLFNRLMGCKPDVLPSEDDQTLWLMCVRSLIAHENVSDKVLQLLSEGMFGTAVKAIALKRVANK